MSDYFVLHKKDFSGAELRQNTNKRDLYDRRKEFSDLEKATLFALENMHEDPILARTGITVKDGEKVRDPQKPYVVAAYFGYKYNSYCMGESDPAPTHEITRCSPEQLETTLRELAKEQPQKIYWGLELKLIP